MRAHNGNSPMSGSGRFAMSSRAALRRLSGKTGPKPDHRHRDLWRTSPPPALTSTSPPCMSWAATAACFPGPTTPGRPCAARRRQQSAEPDLRLIDDNFGKVTNNHQRVVVLLMQADLFDPTVPPRNSLATPASSPSRHDCRTFVNSANRFSCSTAAVTSPTGTCCWSPARPGYPSISG